MAEKEISFTVGYGELNFIQLSTVLKSVYKFDSVLYVTLGNYDSPNGDNKKGRRVLKFTPTNKSITDSEMEEVQDMKRFINKIDVSKLGKNTKSKMRNMIDKENHVVKGNLSMYYDKNKSNYKLFKVEYIDNHKVELNKTIVCTRYSSSTSGKLKMLYEEMLNGEARIKFFKNLQIPTEESTLYGLDMRANRI